MTLQREPFTPTRLEEERAKDQGKVVPVRFNQAELEALEADARLLQQEKLSTVVKQLVELGRIAIHDPLVGQLMGVILGNIRKNERLGISYADPKFRQK